MIQSQSIQFDSVWLLGLALEEHREWLVLRRLQPVVLGILHIVFSLNHMKGVGVAALLGAIRLTLVHHIAVDDDAGACPGMRTG